MDTPCWEVAHWSVFVICTSFGLPAARREQQERRLKQQPRKLRRPSWPASSTATAACSCLQKTPRLVCGCATWLFGEGGDRRFRRTEAVDRPDLCAVPLFFHAAALRAAQPVELRPERKDPKSHLAILFFLRFDNMNFFICWQISMTMSSGNYLEFPVIIPTTLSENLFEQ